MEQTYICNVKVNHIRPEYDNLKSWCEDPNNIYIGRAGIVFIDNQRYPKYPSIWANPYKINKDGDLKEVLDKYRSYIINKIEKENLYDELRKLKGKKLGCWCINTQCCLIKNNNNQYCHNQEVICHGQILLELLTYI
jgi:hypothetical protein